MPEERLSEDELVASSLRLMAENEAARGSSRLTEILARLLLGKGVRELVAAEAAWATRAPADELLEGGRYRTTLRPLWALDS